MNGYLQRLVAGAVQPQRRLRPLSGSVFGADPRGAHEEEPSILLTDAPARAVAPGASAGALAPRSSRKPQPAAGAAPRATTPIAPPQPATRIAPQPTTMPLLPADDPTVATRAKPAPVVQDDTGAAPSAVSREGRTDMDQPSASPTAPSESASYAPLLRPPPPPTASDRRAPAPAREAPSQRAAAPRPAPVEIHIGRIDVVAAQPPRPVAAAAPQARSTSLADYLKRGDRRSR